MMKLITAAIFALAVVSAAPATAHAAPAETAPPVSRAVTLRDAMRELWAEHVIWTRAYVVATVADSPDATPVSIRLLKNQTDIGEAFAPYYGKEAGAKLSQLLRRHILIAAEVVDGAKSRDDVKLNSADKRWHANADEIAAFLNGQNPVWSKMEMRRMFYEHLALTTKEASSRIDKKWSEDISTFDTLLTQMMAMADELSNGIIKQYPEKF